MRGLRKHTAQHRVAIAALCAFFVVSASSAQFPLLKKFESLDYSKTKLLRSDLEPLIEQDKGDYIPDEFDGGNLARLRGIVFGKHGRVFREPSIQRYLEQRPWYRRNEKFSNDSLSPLERANLDLIRGAEAEIHGDQVEPGDLRFWRDRKIPPATVRWYSLTDLRIMRAEIEAIHGKRFESDPLLQRYFEDRYWYKADPAYSSKVLSQIERANLKMLQTFEAQASKREFSVWDMIHFANKQIPRKQVEELSLYELRIARNALYALRGRTFKTPWLREFFDQIEWYTPAADQSKAVLTKIDERNLATILAMEKARRDELATKPIRDADMTGLFVEDLRKLAGELPARHGKVFKDRSLQSYFASQPWYKPNPNYSDKLLTKLEKRNQAKIEAALKRTHVQFLLEEG